MVDATWIVVEERDTLFIVQTKKQIFLLKRGVLDSILTDGGEKIGSIKPNTGSPKEPI